MIAGLEVQKLSSVDDLEKVINSYRWLYIHGIISESEKDKIVKRINKKYREELGGGE